MLENEKKKKKKKQIFVVNDKTCYFVLRGSTSIITGSSDGIGEEFAYNYAKQDFNLVLISRTQSKLERVAEKCKEINPKIETIVHSVDLTLPRSDVEEDIQSLLEPLTISTLINNVGMAVDLEQFHLQPESPTFKTLTLNVKVQLWLTKWVIKRWVKNDSKGTILNLSSVSGCVGIPYLAVYSSTKGFTDTWSRSVVLELKHLKKDKDIVIHSLQPFFVSTSMTKIPVLPTVPHAKVIPTACQRQIGTNVSLGPYWIHSLLGIFLRSFPSVSIPVMRIVMIILTKWKKSHEKKKKKKKVN
ncbi:hypothetical protein M0813_17886 [Anaeramoeba flamelloides]|uniref:Uncharacterized protein n=1 Tax=Anaeramoeba flamelloides TaxID=1746091 RepID=A0ABQ8YUA7_9EUKA|nr:hypothetical protein M0813_17886 [Anaeramoeba flamelloides]